MLKYLFKSTKVFFIISYYIYSLEYVIHDYQNLFIKSFLDQPVSNTNMVDQISFEPLKCHTYFGIPGYPEFSFCFQNYSIFQLLSDLKLNSYFISLILLPFILYLTVFYITKKIIDFNTFLNIIICSIAPNTIALFFGRGLNGIAEENDYYILNFIKVIYLNITHHTPNLASFGPEPRQVASFIIVIIIYMMSQNASPDKIFKLILIGSLIHIYLSILLFVLVIILICFRIVKLNIIFIILYLIHIYIIILLQNPDVYDYRFYLLYHAFAYTILLKFGHKIKLIAHPVLYTYQILTACIFIIFCVQIALVLLRHHYLTGFLFSKEISHLIEYEKGAGFIERLSTINRTVIYLFALMYTKSLWEKRKEFEKKTI